MSKYKLIISYPDNPENNRIIEKGSMEFLIQKLDDLEEEFGLKEKDLSIKSHREISRVDDLTLNTCLYRNFGSDNEESYNINYSILE